MLEGLLSADNAMVLAVLVLGLPKAEQQKALRYGILGAFAFRVDRDAARGVPDQLGWVKLVGAGYLLYLAVHHFMQRGGARASGARRRRRRRCSACRRSGRRSSRSS